MTPQATNIDSEIAPDGWTLITKCEGLHVCDDVDLSQDEALTPRFTGIGSGNSAFSEIKEKFLDSAETALMNRVDQMERGNCPTLTTDRHGDLLVKVVLKDQREATREQAIQRIEKILHRLVEEQEEKEASPT